MKSLVYQTPKDTVEDILTGVVDAVEEFQQTLGLMERVYQNMSRRYNVWNKLGGRHIEPLL